jgi:hypothetical protein
MASILGLPTEVLHDILLMLERETLKEFRRVCRESHTRVTPILFDRVYFDFDSSGTDGLANISRQPLLAKHVKTVELQRRSGLKKFDDLEAWREATIYEYEPLVLRDGLDEIELSEGIMSRDD